MRVGIGYNNEEDAFSSGKKVAETALKKGNIKRPDIAFAFCNGRLDHHKFFKGLHSVLGKDTSIFGGSAIGVITNDYLSYEGYPSGAAVMQLDKIQHRIGAIAHLNKNEKLAGEKLGDKLSYEPEDKILLILYHSLKYPKRDDAPPVLNSSSLLIDGIEQRLHSKVPIIGGGLVADFDFSRPIKQFCGSFVGTQMVAGVVLSGSVRPYIAVMHGCSPLNGIYHRITKKVDSVIYELDDKPIVQILDELFGNQDWRDQKPLRQLTIGINKGKRFAEPKEGNYVNRLITGVLPDGKGIGLFEPDLEQGCEVQFMLKDTGKMIESAKENSENLMAKIRADHKKALFGIYIDCAGRTATYSNIEIEEATEVQKVFNRYNTPLFGFYSGVEIAPFLGKSCGLDWTGVLMVMAGE